MLNQPKQHSLHICGQYCLCSICLSVPSVQPQTARLFNYSQNQQGNKNRNQLEKFLEFCPNGSLIPINHTIVNKQNKIYYFTRNIRLSSMPINNAIKVLQNSTTNTNIIIYYDESSRITYKYNINKLQKGFKYLQGYNSAPTLIIQYRSSINTTKQQKNQVKTKNYFDNIPLDEEIEKQICEKAEKLTKYLQNSKQASRKYQQITFMSEQFYEQQIDYQNEFVNNFGYENLCKYLIKIQVQLIRIKYGHRIIKADFEWHFKDIRRIHDISEGNSRGKKEVRLINVSNLEVEKQKQIKNFQNQYENLIFSKINDLSNVQNSLWGRLVKQNNYQKKTSIPNSVLQKRLDKFKQTIRQIYETKKEEALSQIKKQRYKDYMTQSEENFQKQKEEQFIQKSKATKPTIIGKKRKVQSNSFREIKHKFQSQGKTERKDHSKSNCQNKKEITSKFIKFIDINRVKRIRIASERCSTFY